MALRRVLHRLPRSQFGTSNCANRFGVTTTKYWTQCRQFSEQPKKDLKMHEIPDILDRAEALSKSKEIPEASVAEKEKIWRFLAGFGMGDHWDKFPSWDFLQRCKRHHLKHLGIDKSQDRKLILGHIEGWKQEQRYKLHLIQKNGKKEELARIRQVADEKDAQSWNVFLAHQVKLRHLAKKTKDQLADAAKEKNQAKLSKRAARLSKGLPVWRDRFPVGHPLHGESVENVTAIAAQYLEHMQTHEADLANDPLAVKAESAAMESQLDALTHRIKRATQAYRSYEDENGDIIEPEIPEADVEKLNGMVDEVAELIVKMYEAMPLDDDMPRLNLRRVLSGEGNPNEGKEITYSSDEEYIE